MSVAKQRLVKIISASSNDVLDDGDQSTSNHHEYLTTVEAESTDEDASITYLEDYEIADNCDEDGAFFVEYITEDDENLITADANEPDNFDGNQLSEYDEIGEADVDEDAGGGSDDTGDELYNCNLCGMNFKSINDHIENYHSGQDVLIDVSDEGGATVKSEKPLELNDYQNDGIAGNLLTVSDGIGDGELIVYGEESLEHDGELIDEATDDENRQEVYTFDGTTCTLTKTICVKPDKRPKNVATKTKINNCVVVNKPAKRLVRSSRLKNASPRDPLELDADHVCEICNTSFYSAKSLKLHARMHLPVKSKTLDEACENDADTSLTGEHETPREKFYCGICGKYYDKTFERVHVQMHNGEEKFNCSICNKVFPNEESINMHMNAHQDTRIIRTKAELSNIKLPYGCQFCGKEFARPHEKVKHERVHTGEKPYECELCGKCFRVSYCLTIHMRTHTDARPYVCPQCNKRFKAQSVYNHHLLTHSDERNYKCPYCPKTFKTSVQLSGHKNSHTKPFTCTECNRPFGSLYAVRAHMESHKRPNHNLKHICEICGAKYARRFALNDHMKEQHKDVQLVIVDSSSGKKPPPKRAKKVKQIKILEDDDERELEAAGQSILPNMVEQEITISEIEHFDNEEEVVEMDWLK